MALNSPELNAVQFMPKGCKLSKAKHGNAGAAQLTSECSCLSEFETPLLPLLN